MSHLKSIRPFTRSPVFWLSVAVCTALGCQAQALAAVDTPYAPGVATIPGPMNSNLPPEWAAHAMEAGTPSALPTRSTEDEWHGYAPHSDPEDAYPTQAWPDRPSAENAVGSWEQGGQAMPEPQHPLSAPRWNNDDAAMPAPAFNELAAWVPPPPGPYPNGPHEGARDMSPPSSAGSGPFPASPGPMPGYGHAPAYGMPQYGPAPYRGPGMPWQNGPRPGDGAPAYGGAPSYGPPAYGADSSARPPQYGPQGYGAPVNPMFGAGYPPMGYPQGPHYGPSPAYGRPNYGPMPYQAMPWQNGPRPSYGAPAYEPSPYGGNPYVGPPQFGPRPGYGAPVKPMFGAGYPPMGYPQGPQYGPSPAYGRPNYGPMPYQGRPWQNAAGPDYGPNPYATPVPYGPPAGYGYP